MLPRGLTSLLDSGKNKASSAAGPAAAAAAAADVPSGKNKASSAAGPAAAAAVFKCLIPWRAPPCVCRGRRILIYIIYKTHAWHLND